MQDEVNRFLVLPRDPNDLTEKMVRMIALSSEARALMGKAGRKKMELEFDEKIVIDRYLQVVASRISGT